ncbi:MAG TPA: NAD(P)-dependent oxidoreductase [Alphaproteobacteria bacterium]|jgi:phosphoglycerate dehydrogenase-like enzyme
MKVLFRYDCGPKLAARLAGLKSAGFDVATCSEADDAGYARRMAETEALWHVLKPVTAAHIAAAPRLKLIQKIGVGVNTIDLDAARARGIAVCNMPGTNSRAVAEMTLLLMLAALRRLTALDAATRRGQGWAVGPRWQEEYGELGGRTVGLVGYGAIPALLAPVLEAMGAHVLYTARKPKPDARGAFRTLADLLGESDIVSLHLPLTAETANLIDAEALARMKPGSILVNTARGGLVDERDLIEALIHGHIGAAGLDVFVREPVAPGNALLTMDNVVVAPHVAWLTPETMERSLAVAVENCRRLARGAALMNRVA